MKRIIIFTGKGGVGKTSLATAHAKKSASLGKKTILVSTDMAHNLGNVFAVERHNEPVQVSDRLDILESRRARHGRLRNFAARQST